MSFTQSIGKKLAVFGVAALCFGYFASYVPYSMMTKMVTKGLFGGMGGSGLDGFAIQPIAVLASSTCMLLFITLAGWWKYTTHSTILGVSIPRPQWFTFISGLCTAGQIITTTLAYTFDGVSIVFAMLLMRGGVLVMAPAVDLIAKRKRKIYWPSWVASGLSLGALLISFFEKAATAITIICAIDIAIYLFVYFFRLLFMSNKAKTEDSSERRRYFAEEQLVANISLFLALFLVGLAGSKMAPSTIPGLIWSGFTVLPYSGFFWYIFLIGTFSYGTGLFGSLIYLDRREHTFCVPANRASSIMAGVIATYLLAIIFDQRYPSTFQLIGVGLIMCAIIFLAYRSIVEKKAKAGAEAAGPCCCGCAPLTEATAEE